MSRKVVVFIAISLDGYIAKEDGDISWLSIVDKEGEDYGYQEFIENVDTVIMGRKTYEKVLSFGIEFPHQDKKTYIITSQKRDTVANIHFYNESLEALVRNLKSELGKAIFVDGGAQVINYLMRSNLIDEYIISIIPICLGSGIRLFENGRPEAKMTLLRSQSYTSGLVKLHYSI